MQVKETSFQNNVDEFGDDEGFEDDELLFYE